MNNLTDFFFSDLNAVYRLGGYYYAPAGTDWVINDDVFGQNIFYFITEGSCEITVNGKSFTGTPGDWFFIPAGTRYSYHNMNNKPFAKYWFHFDLQPNLAEQGIESVEYKLKCQNCDDVKSTFEQFAKICESRRPSDIILTKSLVLKLLSMYIELSAKLSDGFVKKTPHELNSLIMYIDRHLHTPLHNDALADKIHMQTNHFIRYFKKYTGHTPQRYIMAKRMDIAKHLLFDEELPLSEIAERTGFCDTAHFSKNFKSFYSVTPGQYRKYLTK